MLIELVKKEYLKTPIKAYKSDSCFDLFAAANPIIVGEKYNDVNNLSKQDLYHRVDYIEYDTQVQARVVPEFSRNKGTYKIFDLLGFPRSSVRKYNLLLANSCATVDHSYTGNIKICFKYVFQPEDFIIAPEGYIVGKINYEKIYNLGDKIAQIRPTRVYDDARFIEVNSLEETERGEGGFGSSGL